MKTSEIEKPRKSSYDVAASLFHFADKFDPEAIILGNVTSNELKIFANEYIRMLSNEEKLGTKRTKNDEKQISQSNCQLGLPNFPHPFVYAMDALITDSALEKKTIACLKVAVKFFNDPSYF